MSEKVPLGETRREAINRVQERLGPATSRPLAEATFWALAHAKKITRTDEGVYLIEAGIDDDGLRDTATTQIRKQGGTRSGVKSFMVNHQSFHKARVSTKWSAHMSTNWKGLRSSLFAPSLDGAEGNSLDTVPDSAPDNSPAKAPDDQDD